MRPMIPPSSWETSKEQLRSQGQCVGPPGRSAIPLFVSPHRYTRFFAGSGTYVARHPGSRSWLFDCRKSKEEPYRFTSVISEKAIGRTVMNDAIRRRVVLVGPGMVVLTPTAVSLSILARPITRCGDSQPVNMER
jgi:hypothetical protein